MFYSGTVSGKWNTTQSLLRFWLDIFSCTKPVQLTPLESHGHVFQFRFVLDPVRYRNL
jgi:hypothetical protein